MKRFIISLFFVMIYSGAWAGDKYNSNTGARDYCISVENESQDVSSLKCKDLRVPDAAFSDEGDYFLLLTGVPIGGATSMTSTDLAVSTSHSYVRKALTADPAFKNGTLADGVAGQTVTIFITEGIGTFILTPTTKTGFMSITFFGPEDQVTLSFVDDTVGWIILSESGIDIYF